MPIDDSSPEQKARKQAASNSGHWRLPLSDHGLAYFDQLVVAYRTLPEHGTSEDPWARAAAKAADEATLAAAAAAAAVKISEQASAESAATPTDEKLKNDAAAKSKLAADAKARSEEANKNRARLDGAVSSKIAAGQIIIELIQKMEHSCEKKTITTPGGEQDHAKVLWSDILVFEAALLRMLWFEPLKTKLLSLRDEYREAMGAAAAADMSATLLDLKELKDDKDFLRVQAEAVNLMSELHWHYVSAPGLEYHKTTMTFKLACYTALVCTVILLCSLRSGPAEPGDATCCCWVFSWLGSLHFKCSTLSLVMLAGAVGAALSAFQRIQKGGKAGAALLNLRKSKWSSISLGTAPAIGALSAVLLTLIFAGGLIDGKIFPRVTLAADGRLTNVVAKVSTTNFPGALTNRSSVTNVESTTNPPTITNMVSITNTTDLTNQANITNTFSPTNPAGATADALTWRDDKTFCQHRWFVAAGADLALLLIWAFIAGFSERLVPDMLSRLAKKAEEKV